MKFVAKLGGTNALAVLNKRREISTRHSVEGDFSSMTAAIRSVTLNQVWNQNPDAAGIDQRNCQLKSQSSNGEIWILQAINDSWIVALHGCDIVLNQSQ
eukprot:CAMPEP_0176460616 /NCGR_PEP_ID=MMETSP0127-20121128/34092_1 /TAXON_ID=938130 /ORGANISM="Platyophrya macrostoma, Strain WH" /LENGTH=98 /DNA_ID=CAMNT_0017852005 /DNA_START=535 /DNA_END=831 /DNA_ORIENTATION=-